MGNTITMNDPNTTTQQTTTTTSQQVNPLGTPDPTAEFPQEIYKIDRKSAENREVVTFELAAVFDLAGIRAPKRQCTRTEFPSIGTFIRIGGRSTCSCERPRSKRILWSFIKYSRKRKILSLS